MRWLRRTSEPRLIAAARREGGDDVLRALRIRFLEAGDTPFTGFSAADFIRKLGLD